jgi:N-methylhydantoinase A/oxoprolinase/acetone carboxylase beta subunit
MRRVGVDVGGTFTDAIYVDDETGSLRVHKIPTTSNPADGTLAGMEGAIDGDSLADVDYVAHGTTIATNAILTHSGAHVGMITTEGFRDVLQIGRHKKQLNFSLYLDLPWQQFPIVERKDRHAVRERIIPQRGDVEIPLDEEQVLRAIDVLRDSGVEAVAICFLFSFLNPVHEQIAANLVRERLPDAYVSVRSEILPQHREYEVFSTVALNAYVAPQVSRYVGQLNQSVADAGAGGGEIHYMTSGGGVATSDGVFHRPITLVTSGPVAGLIGGVFSGRVAGFDNVITLDAGGTSADIGVCVGGELPRRHLLETEIAGYGLAIPMVDLDTIGAGGGSIARVDEGGVFRVGPESAGSEPGPACYGRGGTRPTVTDAELVLGRLRSETPLAGTLKLNRELAEGAITRHVAGPLGLSLADAAAGIVRISTELMIQAVESNSVSRGYDPRDFALVAMGGAGPLFAMEIAHEVGIPTVVVPPHPGIASALGLLASDVRYEESRTIMSDLDEAGHEEAISVFDELASNLRAQLERDGFAPPDVTIDLFADCRYIHQGYELTVPAPAARSAGWVGDVRTRFEQAHEREYGSIFDEFNVQLVAVRVRGIGRIATLRLPQIERDEQLGEALVGTADVYHLLPEPRVVPTPVYRRTGLSAGSRIEGPALFEQLDTTTVIPPGSTAEVLADGTLVVSLGARAVS